MLKKTKSLFNSPIVLLIFSFMTSIIAIIYAIVITNSYTCYSFYSFNQYISISSGVLMFNNKSVVFEGNNIKYYADEDIKITEYIMGYYVKDSDKYIKVLETTAKFAKEQSLKDTLNNIDGFDFIDPKNGEKSKIINKKSVKDDLYFIIKYKTKDKTEYTTISSKLLMSKID